MDVGFLETISETPTGHAIIQVAPSSENAILIDGGATGRWTSDSSSASSIGADVDLVPLQNETSAVEHVFSAARRRGLPIAFNPAPITPDVAVLSLGDLKILIVNEVEAAGLMGEGRSEYTRSSTGRAIPHCAVRPTAGDRGAWAARGSERWEQPARRVQAIDTTAAGDTFIGFVLAELLSSNSVAGALASGSHAAAISVTRSGAADSIPTHAELAHN